MDVKDLWLNFKEVPLDDEGFTREKFLHFEKRTHRCEITSWFEQELGANLTELMNSSKGPRETYCATIQVLIHPNEEINTEAAACDWFSGLLNDDGILDWGYLRLNGQILSPTVRIIDLDKYEEGDFLSP